ncbi:MAG: nitroreductase family protein [Spirochaetes bacterium]|nr:nitroreductase family protein [Spirochaetota bacterium]
MIDLLRERRSIRKYAKQAIEPEKIEILKEAVLRSPSSRNINPWEFIFIDDKDLLKVLSHVKHDGSSSFLAGAALGIVVCGNSDKSDTWIEDCSIASIILQLTAQSLGLGSCWIQIRNRVFEDGRTSESLIQELLGIPDHVQVESIIAIGYPAEKRDGLQKEELNYKKIKIGKY